MANVLYLLDGDMGLPKFSLGADIILEY